MADDATLRQIAAADPDRSTWLTANAGSGKTRVLTDRVARLLLGGTAPERILCLTYTKAAATEMQNRLLARLGEWAMFPDARLAVELEALGAGAGADLAAARRLFAQAIETPGGLKVQTIHSFCASLLRRFPLEAGVPHGFSELDDRSAANLRAELLEEIARDEMPEMGDLTAIHSGEGIDSFLAQLGAGEFRASDAERLAELAGVTAAPDEILADLFAGFRADHMRELVLAMSAGGVTDQRGAAALNAGNWDAPGAAEAAILEAQLLFGGSAKSPFGSKAGGFPAKATRAGLPDGLAEWIDALADAVADLRPARIASGFVARSAAMLRFAELFSKRYAARKAQNGWLDFDDLIRRASALLSDSAMAQWVLFRLDGGIDHILVDEAQDTSPGQWQVVESLTAEFTAGASDRNRTLFVVGDPKQSIYSFQGADIAVFEDRRDGFAAAFEAVQAPMQRLDLEYSFRSSPAILQAVDATFAGSAGDGLGQAARHRAFHGDMPGRVDLWPVFEPPDAPEEQPWDSPLDQLAPDSAPTLLAEALAREIKAMLDARTAIPTSKGPRPMGPGDILILVQGRKGPLFGEILRALKSAGLPVAGADRLRLAAELAVQDIRAMISFLATPEDDLSLAELLRSPLIGLDEDALFRLAHARKGYLWEALREAADHADARAILSDMMAHSHLRPYDLMSRLLVRHGGRDRLLQRLGAEAEDGIDELLSQALAYERSEAPSLTGFLVWLSGDDVEISRQQGSGAGLIRVMTVHGSKGLESPVVILPDTAERRSPNPPQILRLEGGPAMLTGNKAGRPDFAQDAVDQATARQIEERKRLLYVAMTRAESWLIVAAAGKTGSGRDWYGMIAEGLASAKLTCSTEPRDFGQVTRFAHGDWPASVGEADADEPPPALPDWIDTAPPAWTPPPAPVAATGLGGAKALPGPVGDDAAAAMLFGVRLHLLLEHLPGVAAEEWPARAADLLSGAEGGLPDAEMLALLLEEATAVLAAPDLASVFELADGAEVLTEVPLAAPLPDGRLLSGIIDRLVIAPDRIMAIDYKTNATVPAAPEAVPLGILRQMAAYRAALRGIWPALPVQVAVLWTASRAVMVLPDALLDEVMAGLHPAPRP
ncbi:MAG: double-strand break repair helicase AddA [Paracoccus sp. (in: a-proteobacteria)]|nr:double-strand break repair helicase AddA [Paracoccus sp. (in: a-proteobacteria)]